MFLSQFSTNGDRIDGTGSVRAAKRRCPLCGTSKLRSRGDGRVMCKNGHEQAGIVEEVAETMADSMTRRHTKKMKRESKRHLAQSKRLYGKDAQFLILHIMQHILKEQATIMVEELGAPESVLGAVRNIWLLYVSKLEGIMVPSSASDVIAENSQTRFGKTPKESQQPSQMQTQTQTQNQDAADASDDEDDVREDDIDEDLKFVDDSLDSLLQRIDEDIARDEQEMLELENYRAESNGSQREQAGSDDEEQEKEASQTDTEQGIRLEDQAEKPRQNGKVSRNGMFQSLLHYIESFVHLEYLPAILYLSFAWLRLPLTHADLFRLLADERIPYASAYQRLPEEMTERMGKGFIGFINLKFAPSIRRLRTITQGFELFFLKHHELRFSPVDTPVFLLHLIRRLDLSIGVYLMATRLLELVDIKKRIPNSHSKKLELSAMSAIIIVLKLHYGLDEIERQPIGPEANDSSLGLPPLNDFLDKWRSNWKKELSISITSDLTTAGSCWEADFSEYCRRRLTKRKIPDNKAVYRDIAPRYRRLVDSLAYEGGFGPEQARRLLPSQYLRDSESDMNEDSRPSRVPDELRCIEPIVIPTARQRAEESPDKASSGEYPLEYKTLFEPYDNHPEIQLGRGEMYATGFSKDICSRTPGYMLPTLGLVIARCADIIGYPKHTLLSSITSLETWMRKFKDG
ncbi:hypothetical protein IWW45_004157 [Coemansia sp. RSA 485]|nr:hypothetical protein IWW45_004157 [Coemansia sp. RSA 485]